MFKGYHIEKQILERKELNSLENELDNLLKKAGGANYDLGSVGVGSSEGAASYKKATKEFFENKERETTIKAVVYDKGPLKEGITECDLSGRAMTIGQSDVKKYAK